MTITVNGQTEQVAEGLSVNGLLALHKLSPDKVAVELNKRLVRTADYTRALREGDIVEIVTFVGGG